MEITSRITFNTLAQIAGRIINVVLGLLVTAFLTRFLGIEGYGNYVFITSAVLFFAAFSDLGLGTIGVREAIKKKKIAPPIFGNTLIVKLFLSLGALGILRILVVVLPQFADLRPATLVAGLVLIFLGLRTSAEVVFQTKLRLELTSLLQVLSTLILALGIWWFRNDLTLLWVMKFWVFGGFLTAILGIAMAIRLAKIDFRFDFSLAKNLFKEAFPLGLFFLTYSAYDHGIDSFMLKTFAGPEAVGLYGLSYKIHSNLILIAAYLMNSLFPLISQFQTRNKERLQRLYQKAFDLLFVLGFLGSVGILGLAPWAVKIIAGPNFAPSVLTLRILSIATFFAFLNHLAGYSLVALGKQKTLLKIALLALATNVFFNWLLIPRFSFYGAAFVTVLTEALVFALSSAYLSTKMNLRIAPTSFLQTAKELVVKKGKIF